MGSSASKSIEDVSSSDIATFVASLGNNFKSYEATIRESGPSAKELAGMTDEGIEQMLDYLCILNRLHRRKLASVCKKQLRKASEEGECDTASTTSSSYSAASRRVSSFRASLHSNPPKDEERRGSLGQKSFASDDGSVTVASQFESFNVNTSAEALSLLVNMENQKRLLSHNSRPSGPPQGKAAIVLTDIQGSTALWEADPKAMRAALNLHDDTIRALRADHGGYEIDTEGDAFFLAFHSANDALTFALALQEALYDADWNDDILSHPQACAKGHFRGLRVRMGVHLGPVTTRRNAVTGRLEYTGETMDRAREIESMAVGGDILVTKKTFQAASVAAQTEDLGNGILKVITCGKRKGCSRRRVSLGPGGIVSQIMKDKEPKTAKKMSQTRLKRRNSINKSFSSSSKSKSKPTRKRPPKRTASMPEQDLAALAAATAVA